MGSQTKDTARVKLYEEYSPDETGLWLVKGADHNYDLHGSHARETIGYFEGRYSDIVEYALELEGTRFLDSWGSDGTITKITPKKIDDLSTKDAANF